MRTHPIRTTGLLGLVTTLLVGIGTLLAPSAAAATAAPAAPSAAFARLANGGISVTWTDNSADEAGFVIERAWGSQGYGVIGTVGANTTSFTDASYGIHSYTYRVRAWNDMGSSAYAVSNTEMIFTTGGYVPMTATASTTSGVAPLTVTLTASTPATDVTWYFGDGTTATGISVSHTYAAAPFGIATYSATVKARMLSQFGGYDTGVSTVLITVDWPDVAPVVGFSGYSPAKYKVTLSWSNQPSKATKILVDRCVTRSCSWSTIATLAPNASTYTDTRAKSGTTYNYRVRTMDNLGHVATSPVLTIKSL